MGPGHPLVDPTVKLVSCGKNGWSDWDLCVIDGLADLVDIHSVHIYSGSNDYWTNVLGPTIAERAITYTSTFRRAAYNRAPTAGPSLPTTNGTCGTAPVMACSRNVTTSRRAGCRDLPQRLHPPLRLGKDGEPGANGQRHRTDRYHSDQGIRPAHFLPFPLAFAGAPRHGGRRLRRRSCRRTAIRALQPVASRVNDLAPFCLVDATATVDSAQSRLAVTLVNRSEEVEPLEIEVGGAEFRQTVGIRTLTGSSDGSEDSAVDAVNIEEGGEVAKSRRSPWSFRPSPLRCLRRG